MELEGTWAEGYGAGFALNTKKLQKITSRDEQGKKKKEKNLDLAKPKSEYSFSVTI